MNENEIMEALVARAQWAGYWYICGRADGIGFDPERTAPSAFADVYARVYARIFRQHLIVNGVYAQDVPTPREVWELLISGVMNGDFEAALDAMG